MARSSDVVDMIKCVVARLDTLSKWVLIFECGSRKVPDLQLGDKFKNEYKVLHQHGCIL